MVSRQNTLGVLDLFSGIGGFSLAVVPQIPALIGRAIMESLS
jgi:site-specific DNA-cytosine methylase